LTNFFNMLANQGLDIEEGHGPLNEGDSPGLIKPSIILTTSATQTNVEASGILFDRFRRALRYMQIDGHERAASVFSELSLNAAEHSQSPNGAFVMLRLFHKASLSRLRSPTSGAVFAPPSVMTGISLMPRRSAPLWKNR